MTKTKQTHHKHPLPPNPFRRSLVALNHPAAWIVELILTEVFQKVDVLQEEKENYDPESRSGESGTFLGTYSKFRDKDVPENTPGVAVDISSLKHAQDKDSFNLLKEKVKINIDNCRCNMVKQKHTQSYKDKFGNLPAEWGRGKGGQQRGAGGHSVPDKAVSICNSFFTLCGLAMDKEVSENEEGPIGGAPPESTPQSTPQKSREQGTTPRAGPGGVQSQLVTRNMQKFIDMMNQPAADRRGRVLVEGKEEQLSGQAWLNVWGKTPPKRAQGRKGFGRTRLPKRNLRKTRKLGGLNRSRSLRNHQQRRLNQSRRRNSQPRNSWHRSSSRPKTPRTNKRLSLLQAENQRKRKLEEKGVLQNNWWKHHWRHQHQFHPLQHLAHLLGAQWQEVSQKLELGWGEVPRVSKWWQLQWQMRPRRIKRVKKTVPSWCTKGPRGSLEK